MEWGDCGTTFIVDADNGVGGFTDWTNSVHSLEKTLIVELS